MSYLADFTGGEWYMILAYVLLAVFALFFPLLFFLRRNQKKASEERKESEAYVQKSSVVATLFGGKANIVSIEIRGSRVSVNVKTTEGIEPEKLDQNGLKGSIIMGSKVIFPVGSKAEEFAKELQKKIDGG